MKSRRDPEVEELFARLARLGELSARRMFGAVGLYADGVFFGLIDEGVLYFKVDDRTVEAYRARGAGPFRPFKDRPEAAMHAYHEVPEGVLERDDELLAWARDACAAGRRRDASKKPRRGRGKAARRPAEVPLERLQNLGPKSAAWLRAVGITTRAELERLGSVRAFLRVEEAGYAASLNLLYALEGALLELRHDRLSDAVKANLRARAGRAR